MKEFDLKNIYEVPKLEKVVLNVGINKSKEDSKFIDMVKSDLAIITGQKPVTTLSKKAISGFKIRQGEVVGVAVTLHGDKMYDFIDRFINIVLPRIRDFKGLNPKSFDEQGNYSIGLSEQIIFPEIKYENVDKIYSLEVCIKTNLNNNKLAQSLLANLGFPFKKTKT